MAEVVKIKTTKVVYPQVYSFTLPDKPENEGSQKIGYTERRDVNTRIREETRTAAMHERYDLLWSAPSFFKKPQKDFKDKNFHEFLKKSGIENRSDLGGTEWFYFNGTPEKSKQLLDTFREQGFAALQTKSGKSPYILRTEQELAVNSAKDYFENNDNGEFLWNAKPRFGKTLASYDLARRLSAKKVLIVTNRPAIANSWFDDFEKFVDGFYFISSTSSLSERKSLTREQYNEIKGLDKRMITFLSLQDLKGSKYFGGNHDKLSWIADLEWDLLIIDEAHEGIDTSRTDAAFDIIKRKHTLHLSGTPFKQLANNKFPNDAIFNWTYLDEQTVKRAELEESESGDHTDLPDLKLYTYRISQMVSDEVNEGIEIDNQTRDYAFDLNEFFSTRNQKFIHEDDVKNFLENLTTNKKYPFSTPELRDELRHTFWYVGNRVESVKALEQLLKQDKVFKDYKIIVAAGDGKSFDEEENDFKGNEKSFDKVKAAIEKYQKTITLSCGQLTTGVTIKEWSAVLMLTDIKSTPQYMQAAFRAQNPYRFTENGELIAKQSAYLFDFAPTRVLEMYDEFANGLNPKATKGEITEAERKGNIKELLNYFPVISEDTEGRMIELDAEKVLTFPNALAATEIVQARFMTNLLFNDNIKGVFHFPKEVEDILDKMPIEKNKRAEKSKSTLDLDDARKVEANKQAKINENSDVILGEKIYRANIDRVVDNALSFETPEETIESLPEQVSAIADPLIAKYKEAYKLSKAETEEVKNEIDEKIKLVADSYVSGEIKDAEALKQSLTEVIERDFVSTKVDEQETKTIQEVQKSKEDEVRDHLRSFTRTIPMFVMANRSNNEITIENFDKEIIDEDFLDITNITKDEFHKLRDGFEYTDDNGERKHFEGVFDHYKFNASIAEFVAEKKKRANYFETDEDIFELIPNQKNNQIFTPIKVVKMMVDDLEKESPELFQRTDSTFIDLYMKSGMYITEITKRLFANTRYKYNSDTECIKHILENQVYGLSPTGILREITHNYIFGFDEGHKISNKNFKQHDLLPETKKGSAPQKLTELFNQGGNMKFDVVIGNPPYQDEGGSGGNNDAPIYQAFVEGAMSLKPSMISYITPSRWMAGGRENILGKFRKAMLNNNNLRSITDYINASDCFPGVDIKGGVNYFMIDSSYSGDCKYTLIENNTVIEQNQRVLNEFDIFIRYKSLLSVVRKVGTIKANNVSDIVSSDTPFGISSNPRSSKKNPLKIESKKINKDYIELYHIENNKRKIEFVRRDLITKNTKDIDKWKLFAPGGYGASEGWPHQILGIPENGQPGSVCSQSYLYVKFDTKNELFRFNKYYKTKMFRALVAARKISQSAPRRVYSFVPNQNFSSNSDIDWSKSISSIDQQLYKKYGLNQEEIDFIETKVKPMR